MKTHQIPGAPAAIGPYSQAVSAGSLVFCSGQTPLDPDTMELVGVTIEEQTARVLDNLEIVLGGLGLGLDDVVKTNVYLRSMDDFEGMNAVYARRFGAHRPARTTVAVRANPLDARVEIECVAERLGGRSAQPDPHAEGSDAT
jgi:2-iminobutanoate/2-iminopropanoate deaminase